MPVDLKERMAELKEWEELRLGAARPGWSKEFTCVRCGLLGARETEDKKYCDSCRPVVLREQVVRAKRKYMQTAKGKAYHNRTMKEYYQTPEGEINHKRSGKKYQDSPKGKIAHTLAVTKYGLSLKGKVVRAKMNAHRREQSTNPVLLAVRFKQLHTLRESCAEPSCLAPYATTHQIDHIVALSLGGTDDWNNLQPLCVKCHRKKTGQDNSTLIKMRLDKELISQGVTPISSTRSLTSFIVRTGGK